MHPLDRPGGCAEPDGADTAAGADAEPIRKIRIGGRSSENGDEYGSW